MHRFALSAIAMALLAFSATASEPRSARTAKQVVHRPTQSAFSGNIIGLQAPKLGPIPPRPLHERLLEFVVCPMKPIVEYFEPANRRMRRLLNECEDIGQVREQFQGFWMNSQPSVLTYERLDGTIGP
jgi:hypothetical protein